MRLLLDMNLPLAIAPWLRSLGHDAVHARDLGLARASDAAIFAQAARDARVLVTLDLDFGEVLRVATGIRPGTILLRLRSTRRAHLQERLKAGLDRAGLVLQNGAIVLVEDARIRIRTMPPGR